MLPSQTCERMGRSTELAEFERGASGQLNVFPPRYSTVGCKQINAE